MNPSAQTSTASPRLHRRRRLATVSWRGLLLAALATFIVLATSASDAVAAPNITLDKQAPARVLFGDDSTVNLHTTNPAGQPYGYNLSLRDVLPAGVSYVPGSASVEPRIIANAPAAGQTTLIFDNVSDLSPGSSYDLSYKVRHDQGVFGIGDTYTNNAGAYINDDPRFVPDFDAKGQPTTDITGSATDSANTQINAIEIEKSEPSPEGEILRGAHDHQTVYTLTVRNNAVEPTTGLDVEDWLPAGLEYLGCGTTDNTTDAPTNPAVSPQEYAGSGALNPGNAPPAPDCQDPDLVETVLTDPDGGGPLPTDVYTHVVWNDVGTVAAKGEIKIRYVAAIPIRENTTSWPGGLPPAPTGLLQASNLDNNSGTETQDEQALTNYAKATGQFDGTLPVSDDHTLTRTAEDLRVLKSVTPETIDQGQISTWSLNIATSEYRYVDDVRVDDTLPNGLCPLGATNLEGGGKVSTECDPTGDMPNAAYTSVDENANGTWTLKWDESTVPELARMQPSSEFTISFPTKTRAHYQQNFEDANPVLANDSWENTVAIAGADFRICAPADPDCDSGGTKIDGDETDGGDDLDVSAASQQAGGITIDKKVRQPGGPIPVDCATGTYVDGPAPNYGPGDRVCWQLRVDFASQLDTGGPVVADFIPPGMTYVPGSAFDTTNDTVGATLDDSDAGNGVLTWTMGGDVPEGDLVFEWRFATEVKQGATDKAGDLLGNLMKLSYENTPGQTFPLRDEVDSERSQARLDLVKGVRDIDGAPAAGNPPNTDGGNVGAGDVVTFRVDVTNDGDLDAADAVVWDELQDGITCADVPAPSISDGGTCSGTRITWTGIDVAAAATHTLTYDVTIPNGVEPGRRFDDNAGVVSYTSATNTGTPFTYVPANNINPAAPPANAAAADDPSFVQTRAVTFAKTRTTEVGETGNDKNTQATIGERIDYTMTIVVPEGTTLYGSPKFTDNFGTRHGDMLTADAKLNGGGLPAGVTLQYAPNTLTLDFPATYSNPVGDDTFTITFSAQVADVAANKRTTPNETLTNTADFKWQDQDTTPHTLNASVNTTIVEPNVTVLKADDDADGKVEPGQTVNYAVNATNVNGTRVSTAHDLQLVDHVPAGLTPVEATITGGGVWDPVARTITWTIPSLTPSASTVRNYSVKVDDPATAGSVFENSVDLTATSMAGTVTGERGPTSPVTAGYVANAKNTIQLGEATLTKTVDPTSTTIGKQVTYTTQVTFHAGVSYFDTTVIDTLPDGLIYDDTVSVTCGGGSCTPPVTTLTPEPQPNGSTRLGWFLDDLTAQPATRTYEIKYTAHVADEYEPENTKVLNGQTLTNVAGAFYNGSSKITGTPTSIPDPGSFSNGSGPDDAKVGVVEPNVVLDKDVSGDADDDDQRPTQPGDSYTYSVKVTNTGTSPAYNVDVTDTPDAALLRNINVTANPEATIADGDGSDGTLGWTIPGPLDPGKSVTLQYTASLAPSADLSDADTVVNTADVPRFWGVPKAERDANPTRTYREYTNVPDDTVTLDVHLPKLQVAKTTGAAGFPESAVAQVGEPFGWRVVISNTATDAVAQDVDVKDVLPANWTYVAGSASFAPGTAVEPTVNGQELSWTNVGDIAPGGQIVLTFQARPTAAAITDPGTGAASPNVNDVSATGHDASGATASKDGPYADEDDAQAILELPDLKVTKTPDGATVEAGAPAEYKVEIANDGIVPARDVVVEDVLGAGQTYTAGSATAFPLTGFSESSVTAGPGAGETTIEWAIAEIPAKGKVTITVPVKTDPSLADDTTLVNDASVTSREVTTPVTDDGSYKTDIDSDVGIVKGVQSAPVDAGSVAEFTFTVTNHGPSDAKGVTVDDVLPSNLTFVDADPPCGESPKGTITCAIGDLAAGKSVELKLQLQISPDELIEVSNTASVSSTTPDSNPANNKSTVKKPVGVVANVDVQKDGPAAPVLQGTSFDYVITVGNDGPSAADAVTLSDSLPAGVSFEKVTTDRGNCSESGGKVDCTFGKLEPGEGAKVTVTVLAVDVGSWTNTATVATPTPETTTVDNEDDAEVTIVPAADVGVTKSAPATADPGGQIEYTLGVRNNGPSPATGVNLSDTLPAGVEFVSADPACSNAGNIVTCAVGDLAVDESRSYTVTVSIPYALGGQTLTNTVEVRGNEGDLVNENNSAQATTTVGPAADLAISKTAGGATAGGTASWTIAVRNDGPSTGDPVTVTDSLPAGTTLRSATPAQGSCSGGGTELDCNLGALAAGGSTQIEVVADVAAGTAGQELRNRATVSAPQPDPNPSNNSAEATRKVSPPAVVGPNLRLIKTASTTRPQLGKPFTYRLEVENTGDGAATGVRVLDTVNKALSIRRVGTTQGDCSRKASQVSCALGTLGAGGEATVTLRVVPTTPGAIRNSASVSSNGAGDVSPEDNGDVLGVRVSAPEASWTLSKRAARRAVRGGETVRFDITVRAGKRAIARAQVCDPLPDGLVFVRAAGARFRKGEACWTLRFLAPGATRTFHVMARAERGFRVKRVRNVAEAKAENAGHRRAGASVRVTPAFGGVAGGVTG